MAKDKSNKDTREPSQEAVRAVQAIQDRMREYVRMAGYRVAIPSIADLAEIIDVEFAGMRERDDTADAALEAISRDRDRAKAEVARLRMALEGAERREQHHSARRQEMADQKADLHQELESTRTERDKLREALEPFADAWRSYESDSSRMPKSVQNRIGWEPFRVAKETVELLNRDDEDTSNECRKELGL